MIEGSSLVVFICNRVKEEGFTLIEVLLSLSILVIIFLSFGRISINLMEVWVNEESNMSVMLSGQLAMEKIISDIRSAQEINILNENRIKFRAYDQTGNLVWMEYKCYLSGSVPALGLENEGHLLPLINNVSNISFLDVNGDKGLIQIELELNTANNKKILFSNYVNPLYEGGI